ncbi:molybdopterin-binding protein [Flavobacterium silvisoli]|uniref:Molybdopterin-binding protein n=1 Tax=Flavobacterium silvisoli TaxID=2529433 RepID=A0A4Q9YSK1_9FLAO|nr:molybdopterin-binding protein [Flavobacterium silvisoli]TBX65574.1 molybdopterin-binding protein [Flavobacterium silvisoli]
MKKIPLIILLFSVIGLSVKAQRPIQPTDLLTVFGKVKSEQKITLKLLDSFPKQKVKDLILYNHKGEIKDTVQNMKGVLLKEILAKVDYVYEKPKNLNTFYFVCTASDGYKVVFSWNEIYNTEVGNNLYFITEMKGKSIKDSDQRILLIATSDLKAGRRYVKGLESIEVKQVE